MPRDLSSARDRRVRQLMEDLRRALLGAISDSAAVASSLRQINAEGYVLHVLLDCQREAAAPAPERAPARAAAARPPTFRIDGEDLRFLRSIGIDPTRRGRSGRPPGAP